MRYHTFPATVARRLLRCLEFHYLPKYCQLFEHGGNRNRRDQCLDRRIESIQQLTAETAAWEPEHNAADARINGC